MSALPLADLLGTAALLIPLLALLLLDGAYEDEPARSGPQAGGVR